MSLGVGDLSRTPAEPNTATSVCVIGNPNLSKAGRSSAFALIPPSTTTVAPIIKKACSRTPPFKACGDYPARREISSDMLPELANMSIDIQFNPSSPDLTHITFLCGDRFRLSVRAYCIEVDDHLR
jgi:hypothetical protein